MKTKVLTLVIFAAVMTMGSSAQATILFSDDFNRTGNLVTAPMPQIGGAWSVDGNKTVTFGLNGSRVTTTYSGSYPASYNTNGIYDLAFANFTRPLAANETLTLRFQTVATGNFLSTGFAGVSLGSGTSENLFLGDVSSYAGQWGWGNGITEGVFTSAVTGEAQEAVITYEYNTGDYTFSVGGQTMSGTTTANLALDRIRIGAGYNNHYYNAPNSDIAIDQITATDVPEPSSMALLGVGGMATLIRRRRMGTVTK